ncbi:MAG TPA: hypothetical protein IAB84_00720 [Candidatus Choladousia intestinigallinarum]|nr:hypothetical protein [Candidatus Choladousia intestinigallinarum]
MSIKRWITGAAVFVLSVCLFLPADVWAQEQTSGNSSSTTISAQVPESHEAALIIDGQGSVAVNGQSYKSGTASVQVQIPRLEETAWKIIPEEGWELAEVRYNGKDVTGEVSDYTYIAEPVYEDGTEVRVVFAEGSGESETEQATEENESETEQTTEGSESETEQATEENESETEQTTESNESETEQATEGSESETENAMETTLGKDAGSGSQNKGNSASGTDSPETGDSSSLYLWIEISLASLSAAVGMVFLQYRKKKSK